MYEKLWQERNLFDNSDYPKDSKFFDSTNKNVIGKFKDEAADMPIVEFIGFLVRPKFIMIILIQLFDFLYFLFCFAFIDMIKVKYIFLLTHYIISLDNLQNV